MVCHCSFPDDDSSSETMTVFDFYVDESGEFDPWRMRSKSQFVWLVVFVFTDSVHRRLPDCNYLEAGDMLGEVYVETPTTVGWLFKLFTVMYSVVLCHVIKVRVALLMELACAAKRHVLLVGPAGAGKTAAINQFLSKTSNVKKSVRKVWYFDIWSL